jgi:hypothetical protein
VQGGELGTSSEGVSIDAPASAAAPPQPIPDARELLLEVYKLLRSNVRGSFTGVYECLPHKWFVWQAEYEDDVQARHLMVFENQVSGFERLLADFGDIGTIPQLLTEDRCRALVTEYFGACPDPLPSWVDVMELLEAKRRGSIVDDYTFAEKKRFDPRVLAQSIWDRDLGEQQKRGELQAVFEQDPVCQLVYRNDLNAFRDDVQRELDRLATVTRPDFPSSVPPVPTHLNRWPAGVAGYNLSTVFQDVVAQPGHFPKGAPTVRDISYMARSTPTLYGFCRYSDSSIHINPALNSPDVPRYVMEFLMYHEVLHADMPADGHNRAFSDRQRRFQPTEQAAMEAHALGTTPPRLPDGWRLLADQFLDTLRIPHATERGAM